MLREGNGTPLQYSCLENPNDGGAWWAAVHGVAKSRTRRSDWTEPNRTSNIASLMAQQVKNLLQRLSRGFGFHASLGREDPLQEEMATYSSVSRSWWWTGKPGMLQSMDLQRVGHDWVTELNWTLLGTGTSVISEMRYSSILPVSDLNEISGQAFSFYLLVSWYHHFNPHIWRSCSQ